MPPKTILTVSLFLIEFVLQDLELYTILDIINLLRYNFITGILLSNNWYSSPKYSL